VFFAIDLIGFVGAVLVAVRFHEIPAIGFDFIGFSRNWAAVLGGLVIFLPLIAIVAMLGSRISRAIYKPGLLMLDKVLGAAIAAALAVVVALVVVLFVRSTKLPLVGDVVGSSTVATKLIDGAEPVIGALDESMGLDLCGGRLERILSEVCESDELSR
jgi:uncharacterized membrane protein required for colicin V production